MSKIDTLAEEESTTQHPLKFLPSRIFVSQSIDQKNWALAAKTDAFVDANDTDSLHFICEYIGNTFIYKFYIRHWKIFYQ
jgi:hypothetical protein